MVPRRALPAQRFLRSRPVLGRRVMRDWRLKQVKGMPLIE